MSAEALAFKEAAQAELRGNLHWSVTADGTSAGQTYNGSKPLQLEVNGTFGGGVVTVESSLDGGTTFLDIGASFVANGRASSVILASRGEIFRVVMTGSATPSVNVELRQVEEV